MSSARHAARLLGMLGALSACQKGKPAPSAQDMANALVSIPETGVPLAVYQRYKFRHEVFDSMRTDLKTLVVAESLYFADSGQYTSTTSCMQPPTVGTAPWCASRGDNLDGIRITAHGWHTTITNVNTVIFCSIQVGNDTSFGVPSGVPACFGTQPGQPRAF
jgi:hypothetical protein